MYSFIPFLKSILIGFVIAVPIGPIGLLCIRNTLTSGFIFGIAVGIGAALADFLYGLLAAAGTNIFSSFFLQNIFYFKTFGAFFLIYLGLKEFNKQPVKQNIKIKKKEFFSLIISTFFLTLANPITIMLFLGTFSWFGMEKLSFLDSVLVATGIFLGSMLWWVLLATTVKFTKKYLPISLLDQIKYFSGIILILFGLYAILY